MSTRASDLARALAAQRQGGVGIPLAARGGSLADVLLAQTLRQDQISTLPVLAARLGEALVTRGALRRQGWQQEGRRREESGALAAALADVQRTNLPESERRASHEQLFNVLAQQNPGAAQRLVAGQIAQALSGPEDPEGPFVTFFDPQAEDPAATRRDVRRDSPSADQLSRAGFIRVSPSQVQSTTEDVFGRTRSQVGQEEQDRRDRQRTSQGNAQEILLTLEALSGVPEPSGLRGAAGQALGGIIGQFNEEAGNAVSRAFTGVDTAKLSEVRTRAKALASRLLPTITAEESGRFTDTERQIATEAVAALELAKTKGEVIANLSTLFFTELRGQYRETRFFQQDPPKDLNNRDQALELIDSLKKRGVPDDMILEQLRILKDIQNGAQF